MFQYRSRQNVSIPPGQYVPGGQNVSIPAYCMLVVHLNNRVQITKVGSDYSEILDIIYGVPRSRLNIRSAININIIDLF